MVDGEIAGRLWCAWIPRDGAPREIRRALSDAERALVAARATQLRPALTPYAQPADIDRVAAVLAQMFGAYPSMRDGAVEALAKIDSARRLLAAFPAWAIEAACAAIRSDGYVVSTDRGSYTERHWPPSDAELLRVVSGEVRSRRMALAQAEALLCAPVEPPAEPRPARDEVESKLGRPLGGRKPPPGDGQHF